VKQQPGAEGRVKGPMTFRLRLVDHRSHMPMDDGIEAEDGVNAAIGLRALPQAESPWGSVPGALRRCDRWHCRMDRTLPQTWRPPAHWSSDSVVTVTWGHAAHQRHSRAFSVANPGSGLAAVEILFRTTRESGHL
jgi:hypothetical protein